MEDSGIGASEFFPVSIQAYMGRNTPTPLVPVRTSGSPQIWAKLEFLNPSGSTKDRIARFILEKAIRQGKLKTGEHVVEASSGSTSIAMALVCAQLGLRFTAVMPEGVSSERGLIIRAYGGQLRFTPRELGIRGAIAETERMSKAEQAFLPRQFLILIMRWRIEWALPAKFLTRFLAALWRRLLVAWEQVAL